MDLPQDVIAYVRFTFQASEVDTALGALRVAAIETGEPASPRLLRCTVIASQGSLAKLTHWIGHLAVDWRDVVMQGEYVLQDGQTVQIRDLNNPIHSQLFAQALGHQNPKR